MVSAFIYGGKARCCFARCGILLLLLSLFFLLPHQAFPLSCFSSCGKISIITHPFRLKHDPPHCGDSRFELDCVNNVTVLRGYPGEYSVQSINYNNFTIRLVDPNIHPTNCSFLPRFFLSNYNFSYSSSYPYQYYSNYYNRTAGRFFWSRDLSRPIIYMNCTSPPSDDAYYVDTASCVDQHIYAIVGDLQLERLERQCHVKLVTLTSFWGPGDIYGYDHIGNVSYTEIHRALLHGFELSWLQTYCPLCYDCFLNDIAGEIVQNGQYCGFWYKMLKLVADYVSGIYEGLLQLTGVDTSSHPSLPYIYGIGIVTGRYVLPYFTVRIMLGVMLFFGLLIYTCRKRHTSIYENIEDFLQGNTLTPIRYSYKEIKQMTRSFKDKLGEGGFGHVYRGKLRSGPFVAIKMLNKSKANGQEFISEVATIGRIHHSNVVRLIGFCAEGSKRALVYEFMPNGSLDKYIFSKEESIFLTYKQIYEISLGVARGISYLHQGCDRQILHFDIKPHNILLDENFIPKVSDFGLAKLYPIDNSIVTLTAARGTIGYMAPELFYHNIGGVSYKADIYSFGMLLMEMASRRKNLNPHVEHTSQLYFPLWIYDQLGENGEREMEDVIKEEMNDVVKKMFLVALWCIQLKPSDRPSMNKVVEMLEGEVENINMPPKPLLYPHETVQEDLDINSNQTVSDTGSTSYAEESTTNPLLKSSA